MPFGTITSTSNTFGSISGDVGANVPGTLSGSVGVPGPQGIQGIQGPVGPVGPAGPGSTWGGIAGTLSAQTDLWTELGTKYLASNPAGYQTAGQVSTALAPYITSATASASFYPLTGNPSGFLQAAALLPYLLSSTAASTYQSLSGMSSYLTTSAAAAGYYPLTGNPSGFLTSGSLSGYATESFVTSQGYITASALTPYLSKADNLASLASIPTARDNLGLGSTNTPTFAGVNVPGSGTSVANLGATSLTINQQGSGQFTIQPSQGIVFPNGSIQTTAFTGGTGYITSVSSPLAVTSGNLTIDLSAYLTSATAASTYQTLSGMSAYLTTATASATYQTLSGMSDYLAKAGNLAGLASTSSARTNLGLGSLAVVNDAPSDGSQYARKNAAWEVVITGDRYLTSSTTSNTVSNGTKTFTIGTGLSYTPTQNVTISFDASNNMHGEVLSYDPGTGALSVDVNHHTGSGTYSAWVVNVGGVTPATSVAWGAITGTLSSQTDLQSALDAKVSVGGSVSINYNNFLIVNDNPGVGELNEVFVNNYGLTVRNGTTFANVAAFRYDSVLIPSVGITFSDATNQTSAGITSATADSTYQTISGMSAYAPKASPALTGNVTITSNSSGAALFIEQSGTGNILTLHDQASDTTFVAIDQNGKLNTIPAVAASAGFNVPHTTVAPTTPINGDIWTTTGGLFVRINGATVSPATLAGGTFTGLVSTPASTTTNAGFRIVTGAAPTTPVSGDVWITTGVAGVLTFRGPATVQTVATLGYTQNFTANNQFSGATVQFGNNSVGTTTVSVGNGATPSTFTKTVNVGTGGASGSTTAVNIGSSVSGATSTITLSGTVNAPGLANGVKAWVNFNGQGTVAIQASFNVSSITDLGVGYYRMNFTAALADVNYAPTGSLNSWSGLDVATFQTLAVGSVEVITNQFDTGTAAPAAFDSSSVYLTIIR